jgi:hypothetical protein
MSCCGNKREALVQQQAASKTIIIKIREDVLFEYTGETALTVKGSVSRTLYRFAQKGDTQLVDYRDVSGMMAVPALKQYRTQVPT